MARHPRDDDRRVVGAFAATTTPASQRHVYRVRAGGVVPAELGRLTRLRRSIDRGRARS